ncbi:PREDICTED: zinc finger protein-like 1 homolog [Tarenaya hassleriana]|uniref:zinc finger protein-like 1 homolog n=1 Tax=Tarenaya hassleriana TaxID=28532 RepID=UPI00053C263C|nr:PREDICTED: zinc finger protein-like 1 homolog [Tarenaya hassleriana]
MVVCKCRKATKLYCFVHKVPVCGECICFPEHQLCVLRTYSEWVIDGEYDEPKCCHCQATFADGAGHQVTRLGCLHLIHTSCLISLIKSFPPHTAPAGYVCPSCSTPIWPPKMVKDTGSRLHAMLKEVIMQTGLEKSLFGNHPVSLSTESRSPPAALASDPLVNISSKGEYSASSSSPLREGNNFADGYLAGNGEYSKPTVSEIVEIDVPASGSYMKSSSPGAVAAARKGIPAADRQNSEMSYYADDEDGNRKKYSRRGPLRHKFLRALLPFWSNSLPTLPVTAPSRKDKDASKADDVPEGRSRNPRPSRMDPRKILLFIAIMACMATMGILYYRLAQRAIGQDSVHGEEQR